MSQAHQYQSAVVGNTARALESPAAWQKPQRRRTPLAVVAPLPARQRIPFAVFCSVVLIVALAAVMLINISVSKGQYELVRLSNEQTALQQHNEAMAQQAENLRAPQHLAAEAAELGMVTSPTFGFVDLTEQKVLGEPEPAVKDDEPLVSLPPADLGGAEAGSPSEETKASEEKPASDDAAAASPSQEGGAEEVSAAPEPTGPDLGGGTVPAPQQKQSGQ